jgi:hypothetical protein
MADESPTDGDATEKGTATAARPARVTSRLPWIVIAVLILAMVLGGVLVTSKKSQPFKTEGSRAVVLPTGDRARTVVVAPCSPPTLITPATATSQIQVPGAIAVSLPKGPAARTVVIPRCASRAAPAPGSPNRPSGAFVLEAGEQVSDKSDPKAKDPVAVGINQQLTVPTGSTITTVVAAPCQGQAKSPRTTVLKPTAGSTVAVAPGC